MSQTQPSRYDARGLAFSRVLIANRGEIACRIIRTCRDMGLSTVAVFSDADRDLAHVRLADYAVALGGLASSESYLVADKIIAAAISSGAGAIHPGYGFLSENAAFAAAVEAAGLTFIGPTSEAIAIMGSKIGAKRLMRERGVPVVPGFEATDADGQSDDRFLEAAQAIGFPILVKASAGGGGKGMRIAHSLADLKSALATARREALSSFGDASLLIERYIQSPRHLEVQIFGDAFGQVVHLFERECSIQRRHQKVLEEAPSPAVDAALRHQLGDAAVKAGQAIGYRSAGTVEFVFDDTRREFFFLEVNTRLQVEHPVTEEVTGLDLVRLQIEVALGLPLPFTQEELDQRGPVGHAIEARLYAEDPDHDFLPQTGRLLDFDFPARPGLRVDTGVGRGDEVSIHYDPMLAKVIGRGKDRAEANRRLLAALDEAHVAGCVTNLGFLRRVLRHPAWQSGALTTHFIADHEADLIGVETPADVLTRSLVFATTAAALAADPGPLALAPRWRNNPFRPAEIAWRQSMAKRSAPAEGRGDTVHVSRWQAAHTAHGARHAFTVDSQRVEVLRHEVEGSVQILELRVGDLVERGRVVNNGETTFVHLRGADLVWVREARFGGAAEVESSGARKAPMPGKVVAVRAAAGDTVVAGQVLVVLEAMKMEHAIESPLDGVVVEVLVRVGDVVAADQELVVVGPAPEG